MAQNPNPTQASRVAAVYVIRGPRDPFDGEPLYWSNEQGWVDRASADEYPDTAGNLPLDGQWEDGAKS